MNKKTKKAIKENLSWVITEVVADKIVPQNNEYNKIWNDAHDKVLHIIEQYLEGRGLFQMGTEYEE